MLEIFRAWFAPPRHMILLILAAWLGLYFAERRSERSGISKDELNNLGFYGLAALILGGRISYILQNLPAFTKSPGGMFSINPNLFDPIGALAVAFIVLFSYTQRKGFNFWNVLDALTPVFAILVIGLDLSHLAAGTDFGLPSDLPWAIDLWNATRHPTQIYEALASLFIFILLWLFKPSRHPGLLFLFFTSLTAFSQLLLLAFRANYSIVFNGLRQEQILAWAVLVLSFIMLEIRLKAAR